MSKLLPLSYVPYAAREAEARARRGLRAKGQSPLEAASWVLQDAQGTAGGWAVDHWLVTTAAASAVVEASMVRLDGGTQFRTLRAERV